VENRLRRRVSADPAKYGPALGRAFQTKAGLEEYTQRFKEAEEDLNEELKIFRELAKPDPSAYRLEISGTLKDLGDVYEDTDRWIRATPLTKSRSRSNAACRLLR
jgi:hypothetical protein